MNLWNSKLFDQNKIWPLHPQLQELGSQNRWVSAWQSFSKTILLQCERLTIMFPKNPGEHASHLKIVLRKIVHTLVLCNNIFNRKKFSRGSRSYLVVTVVTSICQKMGSTCSNGNKSSYGNKSSNCNKKLHILGVT